MDTESSQLSWLFNEAESIADHDANDSKQYASQTGAGKFPSVHRPRRRGGRRSLPDHFAHIEVVHELADEDAHCDHCRG